MIDEQENKEDIIEKLCHVGEDIDEEIQDQNVSS
jgi:hypothetical protein